MILKSSGLLRVLMLFLLFSKRVCCFCLMVFKRDWVSVISKSSSILSNSSLSIVLKKWYLVGTLINFGSSSG
nr:MAG TPA: hypothetical protein [Caudoviricetes sp.]